MIRFFFFAAALLLCQPASSDDAQTILRASAGAWSGELYYLDYQSGQRVAIPMEVEAELTPDGSTLIRRLTFTDPGQLVHAVSLTTIDVETGELVEAYFREGTAESLRYTVEKQRINSLTNWQIVYEHDGTDGGRPARIRHTMTRDGNEMKSTKEVRFLDGDAKFFLRNGTDLVLEDASE